MTLSLQSFIDSGIVTREHETLARAAADAAQVRARETADALEAARAKLASAKTTSHAADHGGGDDPLEAQLNVEAAERAVTVAERVTTAAEQARVEAHQAIHAAVGKDRQPAYLETLRVRLRAVAKRHQAELAIETARAEFAQANALLGSLGTRHIIDHHQNVGGDAGGMNPGIERANLRHALAHPSWLSDDERAELSAILDQAEG